MSSERGKPSTTKLCSLTDCGQPHNAKGYCKRHYTRWLKWGDPHYVTVMHAAVCKVPDCGRLNNAHGYCGSHLKRWQRYGDPTAGAPIREYRRPADSLDAGPLVDLIERRGGIVPVCHAAGLSAKCSEAKAYGRAKTRGYAAAWTIDQIIVRFFGTHPAMVYGDDWWLPEAREAA